MNNRQISSKLKRDFRKNTIPAREDMVKKTAAMAALSYTVERKQRITFAQYMVREIPYIWKYIWIWQAVVMIPGAFLLRTMFLTNYLQARHVPLLLCGIGFGAAWSVVPVLYRASRYKMREIEAVSRYAVGKRLLAHIVIMQCSEAVTLFLVYVIAGGRGQFTAGILIVYFLAPYFAGLVLLLGILRILPARSLAGALGGACAVMLGLFAAAEKYKPVLYQAETRKGWAAVSILLAAVFILQAIELWKKGDLLQWGVVKEG